MIFRYFQYNDLTVLLNDTVTDPSFYMLEIGYSAPPGAFRQPNFFSDDYVLHFVIDGCGTFCGEPIEKGVGFLIVPNTRYTFDFDKDFPWRHYWLRFNGSIAEIVLHSMGMKTVNHTFPCPWFASMQPEFEYLMWERPQDVDYALYEMGLFYRAMAHYASGNSGQKREKQADVYRAFARQYIETHHREHITVEDIARETHISSKHLCQIFKEEYNMTPSAFLTECRMRDAQLLLQRTTLSVDEVAHLVGYDYSNYFSALFHKTVGVQPSAYRRHGNIEWN